MKSNGNQKRISDYYIGLDVGTDSVGWAVTDPEYNVLRFRGNAMWGVRLFESANTAAERRQQRTARRLNARKRQRLGLLELLFAEEISKTDPAFFIRMKESSLFGEDKTEISEYPLFNDENYNDRDYFKAYPTAYHLRNELISSDKPHDVRLVYLAIHHILKSRGHFLFDMELSDEYRTVGDLLDDFTERLLDEYGAEAEFKDKAAFVSVITDRNTGITEKKKRIKGLASVKSETEQLDQLDPMKAFDMLTGAAVKLSDLFCDEGLKSAKSLTLDSDINEAADDLTETLGEGRFDLIMQLKQIFDAAKLAQMLGSHQYICEAKVEQFNTNKSDLRRLKVFVKENAPDEYNEIFCQNKDKLNNYAAYSGRTRRSGEYSCKREEFCKYLLKKLPGLEIADGYGDIFRKIKNNDFLPKLKGSENSVIPNQLHLKELRKILDNAEHYLEFLSAKDSEGISVKEKIISVFGFRIPYYVGPLNTKSPNSWVVRTDEKIYPWNFEKNVDTEKSAEEFIKKLVNKCPYTGDDVLPRESLLYSEFCVLNEINPLTVNGKPIPLEQKNEIFDELFLKSHSKVTKKSIGKFLLRKGYIKEGDEISGIDDTVKSKLKSHHDFSRIMDVRENREMVEKIIKAVTIFGDDRKMLKRWLKKNCGDLEKSQVDSICRLSYSDWGNLSETLLAGIYTPDENGEARSVIQMLHETNDNLMQLLSNKYYFGENAEKYRNDKYAPSGSLSDMMDGMYLSPTVKRSLLQSIKIVDEIVDAEKSAPRKIFIEVARDRENDNAKERTVSRKAKLTELYKSCGKEYIELYNELLSRDESELRKDALYLYYTQLGICLYSGEKIELEKLSTDYDIDHIFPQSRIKDDSLDNRVLVKRPYNEEKGNKYPLKKEWQNKNKPLWRMLRDKHLISDKKYERLVRDTPLTEEELSSFVARQLVETRQSTKALCAILKTFYGDAGTKIVYSKAGNVSDFRHDNNIVKCRDVNDLHHAKDAYLNIVVGNVYDTKYTENFFRNIKKYADSDIYSLNAVFRFDVNGAWDKKRSMAKVKSVLQKNNILVSRRSYEAKGALFDLQIVPAGKGQLRIKEDKPIEKYGGYNKITGAYYCVVEHTVKGKRSRSIEPVFLYKKALYERDPAAYCREILSLEESEIIYPKLLTGALLEIDGKRLYICGRSNDSLLCKHDYQLALSASDEKYIKALSKHVSRCNAEKNDDVPLSLNSDISKENNMKLYELFLAKLQAPVYFRLFSNQLEKLMSGADKFREFPLTLQCRFLLEILKLFKCDRQVTNLSTIDGPSKSGTITINKSLDKVKSAFLINSSVTGLYRYKTDLLK